MFLGNSIFVIKSLPKIGCSDHLITSCSCKTSFEVSTLHKKCTNFLTSLWNLLSFPMPITAANPHSFCLCYNIRCLHLGFRLYDC